MIGTPPEPDPEDYDRHRDAMAARSRARSAAGREIGELPAVVDPERRDRGMGSLRCFALDYFPGRFFWPFSANHIRVIERLERCTQTGGRFACAMARGEGKTTLAEIAALRALLYAFRRYLVLVQSRSDLATDSLDKIKRELETNARLLEDFPEVCYPIRKLDGEPKRCIGQTLGGIRTRIEWTSNCVVFPTVPGSACSGAVLVVAPLTGGVRGMSAAGPDGQVIRPDLVLIDDAQTRESAGSPAQTMDRESIITSDLMGLAGPNVRIAALMLCTVIYRNDLSDRFLSSTRHPTWQGIRTRMLESFPTRMELWEDYRDIRNDSFCNEGDGREATEFYEKNREAMDAGAAVAWPERMEPGEVSGLQCAMNKFLDEPRGFAAEYQNDPEDESVTRGVKSLATAELVKRLSGLPRYEVPREASRLTAFIDCGGGKGRGIWYAVTAWDQQFGGAVIDYGTWPRQPRSIFAADDMRPGLAEMYPALSEPARLYAGLTALATEVMGRVYQRERGGGELRIERCLIDCGYLSQAVYQWCRESPYAAAVYPSKGIARTTTARGIAEWRPRPGERSGFHWRLTVSETGRGQMVQFDPDAWKSKAYDALTVPMGTAGRLALWGNEPRAHEMIAEHLAAESSEPTTIRGNTFDKWTEKPHRPDNHLLDCVVGCFVAAGVQGLTFSASGMPMPSPAKPEPIKLSDLYRQKHGKRR